MRTLTTEEAATMRLNRRDLGRAIRAYEKVSYEVVCHAHDQLVAGCPVCTLESMFDDVKVLNQNIASIYDALLVRGPDPHADARHGAA